MRWLNMVEQWSMVFFYVFVQSPRVSVMYCSMAVWPSSWLGVTLNSPPTEVREERWISAQQHASDVPSSEKNTPRQWCFKVKNQEHQLASCCIMLHVVWHHKHGLRANDEKTNTFPEVIRWSPGFYSSQKLRLRGHLMVSPLQKILQILCI